MRDVNEAERWDCRAEIVTGRWYGLRRDEQICEMCEEGEVEDVEHFTVL